MDNKHEPLSDATERILTIVQQENLAVWPTEIGHVTVKAGLLALGSETIALKEALLEANVPVVYVPKSLQTHANRIFLARELSPENLCTFLNFNRAKVSALSGRTKITLLEYILSGLGLNNYGDLEIFPFEDAIFRSLNGIQAYVHRDELEKSLFNKQKDRNLAIHLLATSTQHSIEQRCGSFTLHPSIQYRSAEAFREYCMKTVFKKLCGAKDMIKVDAEMKEFSANALAWIADRKFSFQDKSLKSLCLFPLSNGLHRKFMPQDVTLQVYLPPISEAGNVMRKIDAQLSRKPLPLLYLDKEILGSRHSVILKQIHEAKGKIGVESAADLVVFLRWLRQTLPSVDELADDERHEIAKVVAGRLSEPLAPGELTIARTLISDFRIFQKLSWEEKEDSFCSSLSWTSLSSCARSVGILDDTTRFPNIPGVQFLVTTPSNSQHQILAGWNVVPCLLPIDVIQDHIIPAWKSGMSDNWSISCREHISAYILGNFSSLSLETQAALHTIPIVPVMKMGLADDSTSTFACGPQLIDPSVAELANLCFDYEEIVPKESFFLQFRVALIGCGVKTSVDEAVALHRVQCYASGDYPPSKVKTRAKLLLKSSCRWSTSLDNQEDSDFRCLAWLPTVDMDKVESFKSSMQCRGAKDRLLVLSQLPVISATITEEWELRLRFRSIISTSVLLPQLKHGILHLSRPIVGAVLSYIDKNGLIDDLAEELKTLQCIVVRSDLFVEPSQSFCPPRLRSQGCSRLQPYVANVDENFWRDHENLLVRLGVREGPQPADLLKLQNLLESKGELDKHDIGVAVEILNLASAFPRDSLQGLKVLGASGKFHGIGEIYYNDLGGPRSKQDIILTHPGIPAATINRLKIDSISAQRVKGILNIDEDDDEFDQQENAINRISDTLERYPIETTFREYLANADDTEGTSKISWVLDDRRHATRKLITPQMKELQGPSFLSFNDGVFSDKDFNGFKNVGEGSKMQEKSSIGQFGRGSQTMFHFTDHPMILSGDYLLILDPQQNVLPLNPTKGRRKPGVKLQLSRVREGCPDQLAPFVGFFGYTLDLDHFPGTIFRFPLVAPTSKGLLRTSKRQLNKNEICRLMNTYFDEARTSLLFLRRINRIEFSVYGKPGSGWKVGSDGPVMRMPGVDFRISRAVVCNFTKYNDLDAPPTSGQDSWHLSIQDLSSTAERLPATSKRSAKNVECGIAALVSSVVKEDTGGIPAMTIEPRMFNTLPLPIASDLPVHVHASFSLSGDRKSIALEEYGSTSPGAKSNLYLLEIALPQLYLQFLVDLVTLIHQDVFKFWPQDDPPKKSFGRHIFQAFWKELPGFSLPILPKAHYPADRQRESVTFEQAMFDFLPKTLSKSLLPLLVSLGVNVVRDVPDSVIKLLSPGQNAKPVEWLPIRPRQVEGSTLRDLFKTKSCRPKFLEAMKKNSKLWDEVFELVAPFDLKMEDAHTLDGCHILPLVDQSLGTLKICKDNGAGTYYLVSNEEIQLFNFASGHLIFANPGSRLDALVAKRIFNLQRLQLCHVEELLKLRPDIQDPSTDTDKWLTGFWKHWNTPYGNDFVCPKVGNFETRLYKSTRNGVDEYITPKQFDQLPAIVRPLIPEHKELCNQIPGIYQVNPNMMPKSYLQEERSLDSVESFCRFIQAVNALAHQEGIGAFVESHLNAKNKKVLQHLVINHVCDSWHSIPRVAALLKSLPLWPSFIETTPAQLVPASTALWAASPSLMMPWIKNGSRFIKPQFLDETASTRNVSCITNLAVKKIATGVLFRDYVLPLPANVGHAHWLGYKSLIEEISRTGIGRYDVLNNGKLAVDGHQMLKKTSELFDHDNKLFKAAFTLEKSTRFVHPDLQSYRDLWLLCGLQQDSNGFINVGQYLECLKVMASREKKYRNSDSTYSLDIQEVLSPMTTTNQRLAQFHPADWWAIAQEKVFQSRTNFGGESEYCRSSMAEVAKGKLIQCLSEIVSQAHIPVCWSQVPFAVHEPSPEAFTKIAGNGMPQVAVVWRHLQTLKAMSQRLKIFQVQDFLGDLKKTYQYLQDRPEESLAAFNFADNVVWLNMSEWNYSVLMDDLKTSWQSIDQLVLSSSVDSGPIKAVRPGLMVYEKLLRTLGCKSITYPTVPQPPAPEGYTIAASARQLRQAGKMLDITYESQGRSIKAHRFVLAAVSDHCASQFGGTWTVPPTITFDQAADPDAFLSYYTLETMINYAYEEPIDWEGMEVVDSDNDTHKAKKLDILLNLCKGADYWLIPSLLSQAEARLLAAGRRFIDLDNVVDVRDRALLSGAHNFHNLCEKFIEQNLDAVERSHSEDCI